MRTSDRVTLLVAMIGIAFAAVFNLLTIININNTLDAQNDAMNSVLEILQKQEERKTQ